MMYKQAIHTVGAVSTTILAVNGLVVLLGVEERVMIKTTTYIALSPWHGVVSCVALWSVIYDRQLHGNCVIA